MRSTYLHGSCNQVFFRDAEMKTQMFCPKMSWRSGSEVAKFGGDGGMRSYCEASRGSKWKNSGMEKQWATWLSYAGTAYSNRQYPDKQATAKYGVKGGKPCMYKGTPGKCVSRKNCGTAVFSAAQGAKGCEKLPGDVQCCILKCNA